MNERRVLKVLVLVADYPQENGEKAHRFVHVRNLYYAKNGIDVTVLNFAAKQNYVYENINVIAQKEYKKNKLKYDILICHQPNIKNHYIFLKRYGNLFPRFVFFFHGHEVLKVNFAYSRPYKFMKKNIAKWCAENVYDDFKLFVWRVYYTKVVKKSTFIFVSKWMMDEFFKWTRIPCEIIEPNCYITYNGIGQPFEMQKYKYDIEKEYDFITIRNNLDGSKYCIDLINKYAKVNPDLKFLIIGKGKYFDYDKKADNITWINKLMNHEEIIQNLNKAKCGLMLTRTDAQGLMACEMAAFGIPLITSDISVCHEIFDGMENVRMIGNEEKADLKNMLKQIKKENPYPIDTRYYSKNTGAKEVELLNDLYKSIKE